MAPRLKVPAMINVDPHILSNVIGNIYESAYDQTRWTATIESLENLFHGSKACFGRSGPNIQPNDVVATKQDLSFQLRFFRDYAHQPNAYDVAIRATQQRMVYNDHALVGGDRLKRSRFWNEWMAPQDMYDGIGCKILESGSSYWYVDIQRGRNQAAFDQTEVKLMQTIVPHLARAASIGWKFQSSQLLTSAFGLLPFGVILVDGHMRIASINAAAEAIMVRPGTPLLGKGGHLSVADANIMAALQRLVARACSVRDEVIPGVGGDLLIRKAHNSDGVDLALSVSPVMNPLHEIPFLKRHAVIFVQEISLVLPAGFAEQMRELFDLSPKEASLAASLAAGRTLKQAAADNLIRLSTARSYLETIFDKTGVRQQSQLVALLKSAQSKARN
jgi:DNA-binding CsgD family transcriptional regulator